MKQVALGQKNDELSSRRVSVTVRSPEDAHKMNEMEPEKVFDTDETQRKNYKSGRPPKQGSKLTESRITLYVTKEMETHLLKKFGDPPGMRRFLLESSDYPGQIK